MGGNPLQNHNYIFHRYGLGGVHSHQNEQLTYILTGKLRFWVGDDLGQVFDVGPGEVLHLPSNVLHKARALEDTLDVDIFSPPRQDWLDHTDSYFRDQ